MLDEIINQMLPGAEVSLRRKLNLPGNAVAISRNPELNSTSEIVETKYTKALNE